MGNQNSKDGTSTNTGSGSGSGKGSDEINGKIVDSMRLIDSIATKYILTQKFQDMKKLEDKKYCDELIVLTSDILANRLNSIEVKYLDQRTKAGIVVDEMTKDNIVFLKNTDLKRLDVQNNIKKQRICVGIAKFYVKIAHLFSAIVGTINPVYTYKDIFGKTQNIPYLEKSLIPDTVKQKGEIKLTKINLCSRRINSILLDVLKDVDTGETREYEAKTSVCDLNKQYLRNDDGSQTLMTKTLIDEAGIPELRELYMDVFDFQKKKYTQMSEQAEANYKKDLLTFYNAFTGENAKTLPSTIQGFRDIKLRDYHNKPSCKSVDTRLPSTDTRDVNVKLETQEQLYQNPLKRSYKGKLNDALFQNLAKQIQIMNKNIEESQKKLLGILDALFVYRIDPETKNKDITLHPMLTIQELDNLVETARGILVSLYVGCENDYLKTLESFEAIVERQIQKSIERKIENIRKVENIVLAEG